MSANTNSAQGEQIKAMLEQAVGAAVDGCLVDGTSCNKLYIFVLRNTYLQLAVFVGKVETQITWQTMNFNPSYNRNT